MFNTVGMGSDRILKFSNVFSLLRGRTPQRSVMPLFRKISNIQQGIMYVESSHLTIPHSLMDIPYRFPSTSCGRATGQRRVVAEEIPVFRSLATDSS